MAKLTIINKTDWTITLEPGERITITGNRNDTKTTVERVKTFEITEVKE